MRVLLLAALLIVALSTISFADVITVASGAGPIGTDGAGTGLTVQVKGTVTTSGALTVRQTYSVANPPFTPAATPTDVWMIGGSASKTVKVREISISTIQTTAGINTWYLIKRSTLGTGAATPVVVAPLDSSNSASTNLVQTYPANPSPLGTAVGTVWSGRIASPAAATAGVGNSGHTILWSCGDDECQPITLRGLSENLVLNFGGAALPAGLSVIVTVRYTEE